MKNDEVNSIAFARKHQAVPLVSREPLQRAVKVPAPSKKSGSASTTEPTRTSRRRFGDVPAALLQKEAVAAADKDAEPAVRGEDVHLSTPEVLKRRKSFEAGSLAEGTRTYDSVLKDNKRLIDEVLATSKQDQNPSRKKGPSYVVARSEYDSAVGDFKKRIKKLQATNNDLIAQIVCLKQGLPAPVPSISSPPTSASSFELASIRIQLEEAKDKLDKVLAQKNRLATVAAKVGFEPSDDNMKILRSFLTNMFTESAALDDPDSE